MEIDLDELLALAAKATPGPWWMDSHGVAMVNTETLDLVFSTGDSMGPVVRHEDTGNLSRWRNDNDATFIAIANPSVVAELVHRLKAAEAEARKYKLAGLGMAVSLGEHVCVPEGWKLVPVVPTVEMLDNVDCEVGGSCYSCSPWKASRTDSLNVWNEMIAAAPDLELRGS